MTIAQLLGTLVDALPQLLQQTNLWFAFFGKYQHGLIIYFLLKVLKSHASVYIYSEER
jgi:hypothetical protein